MIHGAWPSWAGPQLSLPFESLGGRCPGSWIQDGIRFGVWACDDLYLLQATKPSPIDSLTRRQQEVARMLATGKRYKDIALALSIAPTTVVSYVNQINAKLRIKTREDLLRLFGGRA